jgi:precorrin-6A synthase
MRTILIIGMGAGDPHYMTAEAIDALNRADIIFVPDKGTEKHALKALRERVLEQFTPRLLDRVIPFDVPERRRDTANYPAEVDAWRGKLEVLHAELFERELTDGQTGAFLVWGDPALYDGTIRVLDSLRATGRDLDYEVIPGISAPQALAARHRIPLNRAGEAILVTTGRRLAESGMPPGIDNVVVMLDGETPAFAVIEPCGLEIYWGAYLGMEEEILLAGPLGAVREQVLSTRAAARARNGWIMDTYLLRRIAPGR